MRSPIPAASASCFRGAFLEAIMIFAPDSYAFRATARPIPELPPAIKIFLFSSLFLKNYGYFNNFKDVINTKRAGQWPALSNSGMNFQKPLIPLFSAASKDLSNPRK